MDTLTSEQDLDISVVIPCLNEERTIRACVEAAFDGIRRAECRGEVLVADNGSTDRSIRRALSAGARVVHVPRRGYGAALQAGFDAARGRLLVMGDADLSYDFREIPKFVAKQARSGADLVIGDRLGGGIDQGAMPWSHRLIGNPAISATIRFFFRSRVHDCYCGLRLITREAWRRLDVKATGMEFALEMIVLATLAGMRLEQVPIVLHVDGRDHRPHLKTLRDGYRSFRFLFRHAPITVYVLPGILLILAGLGYLLFQSWREVAGVSVTVSPFSSLASAGALLGWLMILLGTIARVFATGFLGNRVDPALRQVFGRLHLEHGFFGALVLLVGGLFALAWGGWRYQSLSLLGLTFVVVAFGTLLGGLVVSLMGRAVPDNRFFLGEQTESVPGSVSEEDEETSGSEQNEPHSLATQHALAHAPRYNGWLLDSVSEALDGARTVLDVGCSIGNLSEMAAGRLHGVGARVVGLEPIPAAAAEFRRRFGRRSDMELVEGGIIDPPESLVAAAPFDAALCFNVLEHIEEDVAALRRIRGLLKHGGCLGVVVPGGGDHLYGSLDALDRHYRRYTPARLRSRLERAGFEVLDLRPVNFAGFFLWFFKSRVLRSRKFRVGEVASFDRLVPTLRKIDALLGPPIGQSLAAVARRPNRD